MKQIHLPTVFDEAMIVSTQDKTTIPFPIRRVYFISAIKHKSVRGKHAHKKTKQVIFCIQGSVTVRLDDGTIKQTVRLTKPNTGIFVGALVWSELSHFSYDAILLVFASAEFSEQDYIRTHKTFQKMAL